MKVGKKPFENNKEKVASTFSLSHMFSALLEYVFIKWATLNFSVV